MLAGLHSWFLLTQERRQYTLLLEHASEPSGAVADHAAVATHKACCAAARSSTKHRDDTVRTLAQRRLVLKRKFVIAAFLRAVATVRSVHALCAFMWSFHTPADQSCHNQDHPALDDVFGDAFRESGHRGLPPSRDVAWARQQLHWYTCMCFGAECLSPCTHMMGHRSHYHERTCVCVWVQMSCASFARSSITPTLPGSFAMLETQFGLRCRSNCSRCSDVQLATALPSACCSTSTQRASQRCARSATRKSRSVHAAAALSRRCLDCCCPRRSKGPCVHRPRSQMRRLVPWQSPASPTTLLWRLPPSDKHRR